MRTNKVLLIYTGGTIGMGRNPRTGALEPLDFNNLLDALPEFKQIATGVDIHLFSSPIDSSNVTPDDWSEMARVISEHYNDYDGFVILHGTDTMAYTASALSFMFENLTKPVILTGSQLPMGQLRTDGKENLITSLELASEYGVDGHPMVPEVSIFFNGHLLRGNRSTKSSADEFHAFQTFNYPHLCDAGVDFVFHRHHILTPDYSRPVITHYKMDSRVMVFSLFPGIREDMVRHMMSLDNLRGLVMRTFGSGNAPQAPWLLDILAEANRKGIIVVNVSQCEQGRVEMGRYETGYSLQEVGVISGYDSTVEAASTKLMHLLAKYEDTETVGMMMSCNLAGEITIKN